MIKNILFTGGGGVGNELIWRKLYKKYNLFFCDVEIENIDPVIPLNSKIKVCHCNSKEYIKEIKKICINKNIDLIVPGIDEELIKLSKNKKKLPEIFLPNQKAIEICNNKWKTYNFCIKNKMLSPFTSLATRFSYKHKKKVIFKPISGRGSIDIFSLDNHRESDALISFLKIKKTIKDFIVQDFIEGTEYTVTCFINNQNNMILPYRIISKKGITKKAVFEDNHKIKNLSLQICKILNIENIINIQLIKKNNKLYLIEINPRISTTFCVMIFNNIDPFDKNKSKRTIIKTKLARFTKNYVF